MRGPRVEHFSAGRQLLLAALQKTSGRALAKACGLKPSTISMLASGQHRYPKLPAAVALEQVAAIEVATWTYPPRAETEAPSKFTPVNADGAKGLESKPPTAA